MAKNKPDSIATIQDNDLVQVARGLLDSMISGTDALKGKKMTEERLKEMKLVLGYLNATTSTIKTKMQVFKMMGLGDKVDAVKEASNRLK